MRRKFVSTVAAAAAAIALISAAAFAEYDRDLVVGVMKANGALMGELNRAIGEGDFYAAAEAFMGIAQNMKSLETVTPLKGRKAEWDSIHNDLIKAAFRGIGACADENRDKAAAAVGEIGALIKKGHSIFR